VPRKNFRARSVTADDGTEEYEMLRVWFSSVTKARAAARVLDGYGYAAKQIGCEVVTDCPTLLALPVIEKRVGFADVERLELNGRTDSYDSTAEFPAATPVAKAEPSGALSA
jgi:hypothetical protein